MGEEFKKQISTIPIVVEQKLDYIHNNPVQGKWMLVNDSIDYKYSSIRFYEGDNNEFEFLSHYMELFE